ncbi:hypothetical protein Nepgr_013986 [Nepenthes gracilis]|uniref:Uncharacterized protein n=1 Tax=Nepenthes gracilis TaxID=150966 RepID=A0AAD3SJU7_NEPGR|nr:hypothetical protein Nepgr_013986 [Nepenthes gracilis]
MLGVCSNWRTLQQALKEELMLKHIGLDCSTGRFQRGCTWKEEDQAGSKCVILTRVAWLLVTNLLKSELDELLQYLAVVNEFSCLVPWPLPCERTLQKGLRGGGVICR